MAVVVVGAAIYASLFVSAVVQTDEDLLQGLTIAPVLVALTVPIALRIARTDDDPTIAPVIMAAVVAKLVASWLRYWVAWDLYNAQSDALQYHLTGALLAPGYRSFDFTTDIGTLTGTGFIKMLTGIVYAIIGTTTVGGFFVYGWIGFLGLLLLARAFKLGVPNGDARRYTILVLFVPSLLYWPSAIGKEAWMMLALGLCAYGVAALFSGRSAGLLSLALGIVGCLLVRPHLALIMFIGLTTAALLRRAPARSYAAPLLRFVGLVLLIVIGVVIIGRSSSFVENQLGVQGTDASITEQLAATADRTYDGGSAFTPVYVDSPIDIVPAAITVLFRPFPFEARSAQEWAAATEAFLLFACLIASWNRVRSVPRMMRTTPYVSYCVGFLLAFIYAFSSFANFGILARQRSQAIPYLLIVFALPRIQELRGEHATGARVPTGTETASGAARATQGGERAGPEQPPRRPGTRRRVRRRVRHAPVMPTPVALGALHRGRRGIATTAPTRAAATEAAVTTDGGRRAVSSGTAFAPPPRHRDPSAPG